MNKNSNQRQLELSVPEWVDNAIDYIEQTYDIINNIDLTNYDPISNIAEVTCQLKVQTQGYNLISSFNDVREYFIFKDVNTINKLNKRVIKNNDHALFVLHYQLVKKTEYFIISRHAIGSIENIEFY